jgi:hypothetical protein
MSTILCRAEHGGGGPRACEYGEQYQPRAIEGNRLRCIISTLACEARSPTLVSAQDLNLSDQFLHDLAPHLGQPFPPTLVHIAQRILAQPELIENRRVDIANMARPLDRVQS